MAQAEIVTRKLSITERGMISSFEATGKVTRVRASKPIGLNLQQSFERSNRNRWSSSSSIFPSI